MKRIALTSLLTFLILTQTLGSFLPRFERKGPWGAVLQYTEMFTGMGGGYFFFTPSNFWFGQSTGVEIVTDTARPLKEILGPAAAVRAMNWSILWGFSYSNQEELSAVADRIATYVRNRNHISNFRVSFHYFTKSSGGEFRKVPVYSREYQ